MLKSPKAVPKTQALSLKTSFRNPRVLRRAPRQAPAKKLSGAKNTPKNNAASAVGVDSSGDDQKNIKAMSAVKGSNMEAVDGNLFFLRFIFGSFCERVFRV